MTHQFLVLKLIQRETITCLGAVVVILYVGNDTWSHHQLHITGRSGTLGVLIFSLKVLTDHRTMRNHIGDEIEIHDSDECCREHIRLHEPFETHTCCQHRDDLTIASQFRGEEDNGNEDEQR